MSNRPPKATLPGEMYQKNGRWWWKVRLPGERRIRGRALKPDGARFAAKTRRVAEKVACEMWRRAIEADAETRVKAELKEQTDKKIARVKAKAARALEKAEKKAKVEASLRIEAERETQSHGEALDRAMARANAEETLRLEAERRARLEAQARSIAEARLEAEMELRAEAEQKETPSRGRRKHSAALSAVEGLGLAVGAKSNGHTATCEGCGRDGVPEHDLRRIESGQLVCSECMMVAKT